MTKVWGTNVSDSYLANWWREIVYRYWQIRGKAKEKYPDYE